MSDPQVDPLSAPAPAWNVVDEPQEKDDVSKPQDKNHGYVPLYETLCLYAGWLLGWYCLVYAFGSLQFLKSTPFRIPYAESLFLSPLVLLFTLAAFLFLMLSSIHSALGGGKLKGLVFFAIGLGLFWIYKINLI